MFTLASLITKPVSRALIEFGIFWTVTTNGGSFGGHLQFSVKQDMLLISPYTDHRLRDSVFQSSLTIFNLKLRLYEWRWVLGMMTQDNER